MTTGVHAWGVLRQDSMRATLEQGSEKLHRRLREILGLNALAEFEAATNETARALGHEAEEARKELDQLLMRLGTAKAELETAQQQATTREVARVSAAARLERLRSQPIAGVRLTLGADAESGAVLEVGEQVARLLREAFDIMYQLRAAPGSETPPAKM